MDESVVKEFEQQQVGTLKLSQAIRIGARQFPNPSIMWFRGDDSACVLGCIHYAITGGAENPIQSGWRAVEYFGLSYDEINALHEEYLHSLSDEPAYDPRLRIADIAESVGL